MNVGYESFEGMKDQIGEGAHLTDDKRKKKEKKEEKKEEKNQRNTTMRWMIHLISHTCR